MGLGGSGVLTNPGLLGQNLSMGCANCTLDRLSRYEAALWRQVEQTLLLLNTLDRRKPQERRGLFRVAARRRGSSFQLHAPPGPPWPHCDVLPPLSTISEIARLLRRTKDGRAQKPLPAKSSPNRHQHYPFGNAIYELRTV
jgi:hypothetical protein